MSEQPPENPAQPPQNPPQPPHNPPQAPQNPYQPYGVPGYGPTGVPQWAPDHPDAATVLLLGILGMAVCQVIAPFAWIKGARVRREIDASGGKLAGRSQAQIGYVLGIVGSVLLALYVLGFIAYLGIVVVAVSSGA
ncbi:DUF4190 domain-containing protein [Nocardioides sp. HM23]|uniref:DUF4190 domain-containing protein n=1 Tax=Nocardioides bizhenqiangii TaxID=3095076 RepID=UPI002ACA9802|nr:DUF4190 domain-containing protein [Nocardioides sp. HM23]MDZ5621337.1 DUF4190 domain-containing protein [Nocardioides sp. HM23]